jgi:hypothetical protein
LVSPPYAAVTVYVPTCTDAGAQLAVELFEPPVTSAEFAQVNVPAPVVATVQVIVPVGATAPVGPETVAVKVGVEPSTGFAGEGATATVGAVGLTVIEPEPIAD